MLGLSGAVHAQSREENLIAQKVEQLRVAMISGDKASLEGLLADELSYGHSNGNVQTKAVFVDAITTKKSDFQAIRLTEQTITVTGDVAVVSHVLSADSNDGGVPTHPHLGIVLVWKRAAGTWKLIARRAFKVPA